MQHYGLDSTAALFQREGYQKVLVTGTARPFARHLRSGDTLVAELHAPFARGITLHIAGLPSALWTLMANGDTLFSGHATPDVTKVGPFARPSAAISWIRLTVQDEEPKPDDPPVLFLSDLWSEEGSLGTELRHVRILHRDGTEEGGWPTYAHQAAAVLESDGIPRERIIIVPAKEGDGGRTWSNAQAIATMARRLGINRYDVATMGVHARRTWKLYRRAAGNGIRVGVRSMYDPWCRQEDWWRHWYGWWKVVKEVLGGAREYAVEGTSEDRESRVRSTDRQVP